MDKRLENDLETINETVQNLKEDDDDDYQELKLFELEILVNNVARIKSNIKNGRWDRLNKNILELDQIILDDIINGIYTYWAMVNLVNQCEKYRLSKYTLDEFIAVVDFEEIIIRYLVHNEIDLTISTDNQTYFVHLLYTYGCGYFNMLNDYQKLNYEFKSDVDLEFDVVLEIPKVPKNVQITEFCKQPEKSVTVSEYIESWKAMFGLQIYSAEEFGTVVTCQTSEITDIIGYKIENKVLFISDPVLYRAMHYELIDEGMNGLNNCIDLQHLLNRTINHRNLKIALCQVAYQIAAYLTQQMNIPMNITYGTKLTQPKYRKMRYVDMPFEMFATSDTIHVVNPGLEHYEGSIQAFASSQPLQEDEIKCPILIPDTDGFIFDGIDNYYKLRELELNNSFDHMLHKELFDCQKDRGPDLKKYDLGHINYELYISENKPANFYHDDMIIKIDYYTYIRNKITSYKYDSYFMVGKDNNGKAYAVGYNGGAITLGERNTLLVVKPLSEVIKRLDIDAKSDIRLVWTMLNYKALTTGEFFRGLKEIIRNMDQFGLFLTTISATSNTHNRGKQDAYVKQEIRTMEYFQITSRGINGEKESERDIDKTSNNRYNKKEWKCNDWVRFFESPVPFSHRCYNRDCGSRYAKRLLATHCCYKFKKIDG
jgi:hypothetical protein